jgi:hypothetical protein
MKFKTQGVKMKILFNYLSILTMILLGAVSVYAGGGVRTGTSGASELLIPVGPQGIAMGGSNVATATGIEALYWNPAGTAFMDNSVSTTFSHMNYIADIGLNHGAVSVNFQSFGVLSLEIKALDIGDIPVTTNEFPDGTGQVFTPQFSVLGLTYSKQLTNRIAIGVTANYLSESLSEVSANGLSFNAGVVYNDLGNISGLSFGIAMNNIGPHMKYSGSGLLVTASPQGYERAPGYMSFDAAYFELPANFTIGFGYKPQIDEENAIQISTVFQNNNFSGDEYKMGAEYSYNNLLFIRGGYDLSPKSQSEDYIYGLTAGAGINYDVGGLDLKIDYAYRDVKYFNANHIFAVTLGF